MHPPPQHQSTEAVTSEAAQGPALALLALVLGALKTTHGFRQVLMTVLLLHYVFWG
jgi:hypothetical protein